jgi:hypothetical protein
MDFQILKENYKINNITMVFVKILPKVYQIKNYSNSFIVERKQNCIIIDAEMDKKAKEVLEAIEK